MAKKVALINMKGGVGKSTLTANLAWEIATTPWDKRVLVIDLDPQLNCSQYLVGVDRMERIISNGIATCATGVGANSSTSHATDISARTSS